jgi:hypothetical protein
MGKMSFFSMLLEGEEYNIYGEVAFEWFGS